MKKKSTDIAERVRKERANFNKISVPEFRPAHRNFRPTSSNLRKKIGYIVMLRARMFRSLIIRTGIKERNIRARNIAI